MNIGLYQSAAALSSLERWQDAVSQNITSSQVTGYKKRTVEVGAEFMGEYNADGHSRSGEGQPGYFPKATFGISFRGGEVQPTRRELDVAIQGEGFFVTQGPDGTRTYTRNGELSLRSDRTLVASNGGEVVSEGGAPIQTQPQGGPVVINQDGTVRQGDALLGRIHIVKFEDTSRLRPVSGGAFSAEGIEPITVEKPEVLQGYLEGSNITPLREMVDLVTIARAYEANQKLIQSRDGTLEKALEKLG
jgi:flagellar basal body rod protein FlgG